MLDVADQPVDEKARKGDPLREQIDRIVRSEEFRNSEALQRLLVYLADKATAGSNNLKEYVVATEGLGKPDTYDPQHNSAVRIQVGRLRQKLAEYYRREGKDDPIVLDLPKGGFRLVCENRMPAPEALHPEQAAAPLAPPSDDAVPPVSSGRPNTVGRAPYLIAIAGLVICLLVTAAVAVRQTLLRRLLANSVEANWTPEIAALWNPITASKRPVIFLVEDPLFVELHSSPGVYYRDRSLNSWSDVLKSDTVHKLGRTVEASDMQPSRYYTAFGEVDAAFRLSRFLAPHVPVFSLAKASTLTWQQMADYNVVFVGVENLFFEQTGNLPVRPQLIPVLEGVSNPHPKPDEPALFTDQYKTAPAERGVVYAIVSHLPGPLGSNDVESFTSNRSPGYVGAVQAFADPAFARTAIEKLKAAAGGRMPRYYQVLLRVRFTDDVPTETAFVLARELP
jgi:hypothetical protein